MASERQHERAGDHDEEAQHAMTVAGVGQKFNSDELGERQDIVYRPQRLSH